MAKAKKAVKKKAAKKKTAKHAPKRKTDAMKSTRRKLIDHFAGSSSSLEQLGNKLADVTGKGLTGDEKTAASKALAAKILRGKRR